ncbi:MAG: iron ABC transporter permease, partial [Kamptonema sp. SIO4C4]|nr:iron ABC transporter permease [Kamptonema sp. SIO4C4]
VRRAWVKGLAIFCVVGLAGGSVAIAGSIGFIGLVVPHLAQFLGGVDYRWKLPYAAILGAILLLMADILARLLLAPEALPVGLVTPLIGVPVFLLLLKFKR